ncbi:MAG: HEAT repeat domain-containing protein [Phycisphaerales bacterium]|nr:HEAT repeat domain-containing protein [Phycisphaerales bacterium]
MIGIHLLSMLVVAQAAEATPDPASALVPVENVTVEIWAETPMVMDPVAFCVDDQGRVYVAESFRQEHGVEDNRSQPYWLLDDLAAMRVEDRLAKYEKWAEKRANGMDWYTEMEDRIRRVEDTDGDGVADTVTIFADGFNGPLDGTGAGLIVNGDELWYTCIPHLWRLTDEQDDGVADSREPIFSGFGVRDALRGHDMHGLAWGTDGRIYWSIGDRGYHVTTPEGRVLADPRSGAVFRCEPDGSNLEVFCTGLRNPQELLFDRFGNLFTGDNNSDAGDRARIVYCAEASETGWEMNYQTLGGDNVRGPWSQEGLWETDHEGRPAWSLPPLAHVGSGPSGFVAYPGQGLSDRYVDHVFMCNFLGGPTNSGVIAMKLVPDGAGFRVDDVHDFVKGVLCTDVDFDWDGSMLISDWVEGWYSTETGRIFRLRDQVHGTTPGMKETALLVAGGFESLDQAKLLSLLSHADMRVRRRAHYELAYQGDSSVEPLTALAQDPEADQMARLHAIWALGMIARYGQWTDEDDDHPLEVVRDLAWDDDEEIRIQAVRTLGDETYGPAREDLLELVFDESPRVIYHAVMGLGRYGDAEAIDPIVEMIWTNDNEDRWLRHAGAVALARIGDRERLLELLGDQMPAVRMAAVLALRRMADPAVARVLRDPDPLIAAEAARAINDVPIFEAESALADVLPTLIAESDAAVDPLPRVTVEIFTDVPPTPSGELEALPVLQEEPDEVLEVEGFLLNGGEMDRYVSRMTGRVVPTRTGAYRFAITSDDSSVLLIWPEGQPEKKQRVAKVNVWTPLDQWSVEAGQISDPIEMTAGEPWIVQAIHSEGGGGDHVAVGWQHPDGTWERPIGMTAPDRTRSAIVRRSLAAALRSGEPERAEVVAALALDRSQGDVLRREAMEVLRQWPDPEPRERVQGRYRPVEGPRDIEGWRMTMSRVLPALAESDAVVATPARELAAAHGIALDPAMLFATLRDDSMPSAQRASALGLLALAEDSRSEAIELALASPDSLLRADGLRLAAIHRSAEAMPLVMEMLESEDVEQRRAAIESLGIIDDARAESELMTQLATVTTAHPAVALDVVEAARRRGGDRLTGAVAEWVESPPEGYAAAYTLAAAGGHPDRGRELVFYHAGASCLRCHIIGDTGGTAGPPLTDVGQRLDTAALLRSLMEPQAEITEGFGEASAMPAMATHLDPMQIRDVVAYLESLRGASN